MSFRSALKHITLLLLLVFLLHHFIESYVRCKVGNTKNGLDAPSVIDQAHTIVTLPPVGEVSKESDNKENIMFYNDKVLTISDLETPDPYVTFDKGVYYMVQLDSSCPPNIQ
jgi:hypothetical protein